MESKFIVTVTKVGSGKVCKTLVSDSIAVITPEGRYLKTECNSPQLLSMIVGMKALAEEIVEKFCEDSGIAKEKVNMVLMNAVEELMTKGEILDEDAE